MRDWITKQIMKLAAPSVVASVVRGLMKVLAGVFATLGVEKAVSDSFEDSILQIALAAVSYFIAQYASNKDKKQRPEQPQVVK